MNIPMVCISLERRPDRWADFKQQTDAAGMTVTRLPAVDAKEFDAVTHPAVSLLTAHNIKHKMRRSVYEIDTPGAVGCTLSHIKAWEYLVNSPAQALVIFEDDADIPLDFNARLTHLMNELPSDWDVITFYNTRFSTSYGCSADPATAPFYGCTGLMGSHAYMVSRRGAQRLLARARPIELHVDAYIAFMSRMGHAKLQWHPVLQIAQKAEDSDIAHGLTRILNVPTDMDKSWTTALDATSVVGLVIFSAVAGGIVSRVLMK